MTTTLSYFFNKQKDDLIRLLKEPALFVSILIVACGLMIFVLYPLFNTIKLSFFPQGNLSLEVYKYIIEHSRFRNAIFNSLTLGAIVATTGTTIAFIFAYTLTRVKIPGSTIFKGVVLMPIISPPFMFAFSVILLFGRNGLVTAGLLGIYDSNIYGLPGLVIVQTISLFPLGFLVLSGILQAIDPDLETCAMNLGAKQWKVFTSVTLPLALPGIMAAWLLIFVQSLTDFGNPIIIGGEFDVLSVQAYLQFVGMGNFPRGAGLAIILLIPTISFFMLQKYILRKKSYVTITGKSTRRSTVKLSSFASFMLTSLCFLISAFMMIFYLTIFVGSFIKIWGINWNLTFDHYVYAFDVGFETIIDTVSLAVIATPITAILGMLIAYFVVRKSFPGKHIIEITSLMMFAVPGTAVGIGYIISFNKDPLALTGTMYILLACYIFRNIPIGIESGIAALNQISRDIEESSTNLGATSAKTFRSITLPLITPAFFSGATFAFVKCMTSLSAIIFLVSASWKHMTALILAQTENMLLGQAYALSVILIIIIMIGFAILKKLTGLGQKRVFGKIT